MVGQNGSGKTTLAKHLNGLLRPSQGQVRVGDWTAARQTPAQMAARVGYVFQNPDDQLFRSTVRGELSFGPQNLGWPAARIDAQVESAARLLGLGDQLDANPYDLTPAWRKRVAIASVLAMDTPIVLLDEPTTGQDYRTVEELGRVLGVLRTQGKTVIAISHDMDFVADHFDRVIVMAEGEVLLDRSAAEVFADAAALARTDVEPPQLARLAQRLGFGPTVYLLEDFVEAVRAQVVRNRVDSRMDIT
jgi:energy-coupling factor transport system ATP-binding protein